MSQKTNVNDLMYAGLFAALTAVLGLVSIPLPFSPVPITGQSLAVMLAGCVLSVRQAGYALLTSLLVGAVGVPVFAGGSGGFGIIAGPRGGYLIGYLLGAMVISYLKGQGKNVWRLALANIVGGIGVVYVVGVVWLSAVTGMPLSKALAVGALPFIPGDLIKVVVASGLAVALNRQLCALRGRTA